jgi:general transcription factor 3C protein 4
MYSGVEDSIASFIGLNSDYYFTSWTQGFGCPSLVSLRLGLSVADLCWVRELGMSNLTCNLLFTETMQGPRNAGAVWSSFTGPPSCHLTCVLWILVCHLKAITFVITGTAPIILSLFFPIALDIRSVFYEVAQLLLPGSLQDLSDEAQAIRDTLTPHLSSLHGYPVIVSTSQVRICIG